MSVSYIITDNTVTLNYSDGELDVLPIGRAGSVLEAIKAGLPEAEVRKRASAAALVCDYMNGTVKVEHGRVLYKGEELHGFLVDKILEFANKGYPYKSLLAFLERLMANPSNRAITELYQFLERGSLAITDDGKFRAYKSIQPDWTDWHSGKCDNHIGNILEMPRRCVDDNCNNGCSHGFHVGTLDYVHGFHPGTGIIVIVEVDPADVVSVPVEDCGKVRVCKYKVVGKYTGPLPSYLHTNPDPAPDGDWVPQDGSDGGDPEDPDDGDDEELDEDDLDNDLDQLRDHAVPEEPQTQHITITKPSGSQVFITVNQ